MGKGSGRRRDRDREAIRQRIIEAAFRVLLRKGFRGTSNREIAQEAGISPGLIYWYFRNKEDLFQAVVEAKAFVLPLRRMAREMQEAPPQQFLSEVMRMGLSLYEDAALAAALRLLLPEAIHSGRIRQLLVSRAIRPGLEAITAYLAAQQAKGAVRSLDPRVGAHLFMGLLFSQAILSHLLRLRSPVPARQLFAEALEMYLHGILSPEAGEVSAEERYVA
ncbi:MAG: TetR/AcrR family transcriptional regulator [Thermoflexus sp.]|nr:TetR/AcrR family transcriptional regulator [Thermoflexus sp.]